MTQPPPTPTTHPTHTEAVADAAASSMRRDIMTKNPDPHRCVCRFDTDGTTVCGVHGNYAITYYDDRDDK